MTEGEATRRRLVRAAEEIGVPYADGTLVTTSQLAERMGWSRQLTAHHLRRCARRLWAGGGGTGSGALPAMWYVPTRRES